MADLRVALASTGRADFSSCAALWRAFTEGPGVDPTLWVLGDVGRVRDEATSLCGRDAVRLVVPERLALVADVEIHASDLEPRRVLRVEEPSGLDPACLDEVLERSAERRVVECVALDLEHEVVFEIVRLLRRLEVARVVERRQIERVVVRVLARRSGPSRHDEGNVPATPRP